MLGRYVAGTLLILGGAMAIAPDAPEGGSVDVARAPSTPATASVGPAQDLASAVNVTRAETAALIPASAPTADRTPPAPDADAMQGGIEEALASALELDSIEGETALDASDATVNGATQEVAALGATDSDGVWQGLSETNSVTELVAASSPNSEPRPEPEADQATMLYVTGTRVNVRAGPSTQFDVVGSVSSGDAVELVSDSSGNWAEIRFPDTGETGFMSRRFLSEALSDG